MFLECKVIRILEHNALAGRSPYVRFIDTSPS